MFLRYNRNFNLSFTSISLHVVSNQPRLQIKAKPTLEFSDLVQIRSISFSQNGLNRIMHIPIV